MFNKSGHEGPRFHLPRSLVPGDEPKVSYTMQNGYSLDAIFDFKGLYSWVVQKIKNLVKVKYS
jgi:hypothetical protein